MLYRWFLWKMEYRSKVMWDIEICLNNKNRIKMQSMISWGKYL